MVPPSRNRPDAFCSKLIQIQPPVNNNLRRFDIHDMQKIFIANLSIIDHQQSWKYEEGPWKGPGPRSADSR